MFVIFFLLNFQIYKYIYILPNFFVIILKYLLFNKCTNHQQVVLDISIYVFNLTLCFKYHTPWKHKTLPLYVHLSKMLH